jgi:hypothetical protein
VAQIRDHFARLCDAAPEYLEGLIRAHPRSAAYHARRILELRERYSAADVASALVHALSFQAFSFTAVTRVLEARARPRTLDEYVAERTEDKLRGLLREERLRPRDLSTYDRRADAPVPPLPSERSPERVQAISPPPAAQSVDNAPPAAADRTDTGAGSTYPEET